MSGRSLIHILSELAHPDDIVVADTGFMGAWGGVLYPIRTSGRTFLRAAGTPGMHALSSASNSPILVRRP